MKRCWYMFTHLTLGLVACLVFTFLIKDSDKCDSPWSQWKLYANKIWEET